MYVNDWRAKRRREKPVAFVLLFFFLSFVESVASFVSGEQIKVFFLTGTKQADVSIHMKTTTINHNEICGSFRKCLTLLNELNNTVFSSLILSNYVILT